MRPGISDETLAGAGVKHVDAAEAKALCGLEQAGLWLPYRNIDGGAIRDGDKEYGRLRLDKPQEKKKYHQAAGTHVHAYFPPGLAKAGATGGDLLVIEGEFKSLSLAEAGYAAVGISGFYSFGLKDGGELVPELAAAIEFRKPERLLFCGDSDTALNYLFAHAAVRLARLIDPLPLLLPRIPMNGPGKGADDCRAVLGTNFPAWWQERIAQAIAVAEDTAPERLAITLFEAEAEAIKAISGPARWDLVERLTKLAAALKNKSYAKNQVVNFVVKNLDLGRRDFGNAVSALEKQAAGKKRRSQPAASGVEINSDEPAKVWTRQVWETINDLVYRYSKQIWRFHEGQLLAQSAAAMVSFLDDPKLCRFQRLDKEGEPVRAKFNEADARVFLESWQDSSDLIRTVEVFSPVPVLAWDGRQAVLVNDYNPALRILARGKPLILPSPTEAVDILVQLLCDYDFVKEGDLGRTISMLLSPALAQGGFLGSGRVPLFLIEKSASSTGGSLLLRLASQIYGLKPKPISRLDNRDKAVEDISRLLLSGAGFIYFDNARGRGLQNLPELESLLTEPNFTCRAPYLHGEADVTRRVLAVSSNGALFSRDLATRTVKIAIRKQPDDHVFKEYPEGGIEDHVVANMERYLGAVFSLVKDWADAGRSAGKDLKGFRFSHWERACAWILQKHFPGLPLLDADHQESQERLADPDHDLLRNLFRLVVEGESRSELTASSLAEIGAQAGLLEADEQQSRLRVGKAMKRRFPTDGDHSFDGGHFKVVRDTRVSTSGNGHDVSFYEIYTGGNRNELN
jgi:hypothetical protein